MRFTYDEDVENVMAGYRDSSTWDIPIKVRLYWDNNGMVIYFDDSLIRMLDTGYPEIMDRVFYLIHSINGQLSKAWVDYFRIADIEFTMIDDDPQVQDSSLRREGEGTADGVDHLTGYYTGNEFLGTCHSILVHSYCPLVNSVYVLWMWLGRYARRSEGQLRIGYGQAFLCRHRYSLIVALCADTFAYLNHVAQTCTSAIRWTTLPMKSRRAMSSLQLATSRTRMLPLRTWFVFPSAHYFLPD